MEPPATLGAEARKEWDRVAPVLADRNIATQLDMTMLAMYCQHIGYATELHALLERVSLRRDAPRWIALVRAHRQETQAALRLAVEFGLTPSSRVRLGIPNNRKASEIVKKYFS